MAINTSIINGFVHQADGSVREKSYVIFEQTGFDTDADSDAVVVSTPIRAPIAADGTISQELWPNPDGVRGTFYHVTFELYNGSSPSFVSGGLIEVPATAGPFALNELLVVGAPSGTELIDFIELTERAELAATNAEADALAASDDAEDAASSAIAAGLSAVDADASATAAENAAAQATIITLRYLRNFSGIVLDQDGNILYLVDLDGRIISEIEGLDDGPRDSPHFDEIILDQSGNIQRIVRKNGTPVASAPMPNGDVGEYFRDTDAFRRVVTNTDGYVIDIDNGDIDEPIETPLGEVNLFIVYGQSPFLGSDTTAISTAPVAGLKMFNGGSLPTSSEWNDPANFTSFVDHVTSGEEDGTRGAAEGFQSTMSELTGVPYTDTLVTVAACQGGKTAVELSEGGDYFFRLGVAIDAFASITNSTLSIGSIVPVLYWQGEADISLFTSSTLWLRQVENGIRLPLQAKVDDVFGEGHTVVMVMMQPSSAFYYNKTEMTLATEIVRLCENDPHYFYGGTTYQYEYGANGVGSHLLTGSDVKRAAFSGGAAVASVVYGGIAPSIQAVTTRKKSSRLIEIEYDVPTLPLVLDTVAISDPSNCGYEIERTDTGEDVPIQSVEVSRGSRIKIRSASTLPDAPLRVKYAWIGGTLDDGDADPFGSAAGPTTGQRGCLRDSTVRTVDVGGTPIADPHFAPIAEYNVE